MLINSVSDSHLLYANPDPTFYTNADPDRNPGKRLADFTPSGSGSEA
jgi:hypothetical protein